MPNIDITKHEAQHLIHKLRGIPSPFLAQRQKELRESLISKISRLDFSEQNQDNTRTVELDSGNLSDATPPQRSGDS